MEKKLPDVIRDWVEENRKVFWKYEVSCFHKTYKISIGNFPNPTKDDIFVSPNNGSLSKEKTQLCNAIKKACIKNEASVYSRIDVKVDYADGSVVATVV